MIVGAKLREGCFFRAAFVIEFYGQLSYFIVSDGSFGSVWNDFCFRGSP